MGRRTNHRNRPSGTSWQITLRGASGPDYFDTIWYGQSNSLYHFSTSSSPPAAAAGTQVWDPGTSAWITPVGNGIREFLNAMTTATGRPCRAVYGGQSGVNIADLQKGAGTGHYETLLARVVASGISPDYINLHHGEGDANTASPSGVAYQTAMDTLHGSIATDTGKTRATCPMVISSIGPTDATWTIAESSWQTIKDAQVSVNATYANIHYSHSNMDTTRIDDIHWTGAGYGRSGARYARTILALMGSVATRPKWFATAVVRVTATTTRMTVVHAMGSDISPATGIDGFDLSGDNWATSVAGTGAREDATNILITHADLGTTQRRVRYHYGKRGAVSFPAKDNSALAVPLNYTTPELVAAGAATLPVLTYVASVTSGSNGVTQSFVAQTVAGGSQALLAVIGMTSQTDGFSSVSVTASPSGTVIAATLVENQAAGPPGASIWQAQLPSGTTSITVSVTYAFNPFIATRMHLATVPVADLSSTTKVGSNKARTTAATTATTTLATTSGGCVFVVGSNSTITGTPASVSGTETYVTRSNTVTAGASHCVGDASNVATAAASSVTVTFNASGSNGIVAASWR